MSEVAVQSQATEWTPVPDPTRLTTAQLYREISALQTATALRLQALTDKIDTAVDTLNNQFRDAETSRKEALREAARTIQLGLDKAEQQLQVSLDRAAADTLRAISDAELRAKDRVAALDKVTEERVGHLHTVNDEQFRSIQQQFAERDVRIEQTSKNSKVAVDAALQAAEKAVGKSELVTVKQIDQQGALITTATGALRQQIDDVKDRITRIEGTSSGQTVTRQESHTSSAFILSVIVACISLVGLLVTLAVRFQGH